MRDATRPTAAEHQPHSGAHLLRLSRQKCNHRREQGKQPKPELRRSGTAYCSHQAFPRVHAWCDYELIEFARRAPSCHRADGASPTIALSALTASGCWFNLVYLALSFPLTKPDGSWVMRAAVQFSTHDINGRPTAAHRWGSRVGPGSHQRILCPSTQHHWAIG